MKKNITILTSILMLMSLPGCGQPTNMPSQPEEAAQWGMEGFAVSEKLEEKQSFWAGQYLPWKHGSGDIETEELIYLDMGVCGELFWYFGTLPVAGGMRVPGTEREYVIEIYDSSDRESVVRGFSPGELGVEGESGYLADMDMLDEGHYIFRWVDYRQDEGGMYSQTADKMLYTDFAGECRTVELWDIYMEKGIVREEFTELPLLQSVSWRCDGRGNICVMYGDSGLCLFDKNGETLMEYEPKQGRQMVEPLRTPDGELILPVYDEAKKCYEFLWVDTEGKTLRPLAQMKASTPFIIQIYGMLGDDIYYRSQEGTEEGIVKWNTASGKKVQVFGFQTAGIDRDYRTMLALREGQSPVLRLTKFKEGKPKEWIAVLEEQKPAADGVIRVADLTGSDASGERVAQCAVSASLENPNFTYEYEDVSASEARDRIMAQLSQGKGPELMFVPLEDFYLLEEKEMLLDIGGLISRKLREELLPGVLEIGVVDERLLGVPVAVRAKTLAVSGGTWTEDTWGLEDVISLMEEKKLTGALRSPYVMNDYLPPSLTVLELINYSLADSFLIDWENRKSHFDDERFIRLLELTGTDMSSVSAGTDTWLDGEKNIVWGYFTMESSFLDFFAHMEEEDGRIVGYPTEGACGSYLVAEGGVLVVNANIAQTEAALCFLEILLGEELQSKKNGLCLSIRRLSPEDYIVKDESGRLLFMGGINAPEVPVFQDGTTSLHRAAGFLENCRAAPPGDSQITKIISEELSAMYAEDKSPGATAAIINSRVQLYLDEGN